MNSLMWNTPETLRQLLCELVSWDSRTLTQGEKDFSIKLEAKLRQLPYFAEHPEYLNLHDAGEGRSAVSALYKSEHARQTIVLISHFDTVQTEEYGELEPLAFHPEELTVKLQEPIYKNDLPKDAQQDVMSNKYLFGRGTMDMKIGLALHIQLIEKAIYEQWPINILLTTVPDEEVNSAGMRALVPELITLREKYNLQYELFLNSEPSFSQEPNDINEYIYSGTIGKIMPAALFYGKETHVGEPMKGITAPFIASFMTQLMEWNPKFRERDRGESTPLPVSLQLKDLKSQYSTQTPYRASALYNVFLMKRTADEVMALFKEVAEEAMEQCNTNYRNICERERVAGVGDVKVYTYSQLMEYAEKKLGKDKVANLKQTIAAEEDMDDREKSLRIVDALMIDCQELAPATVLLFAPPYYPAINSSDHKRVQEAIEFVKNEAQKFDNTIKNIHYFNGICDLSYVNYEGDSEEWQAYENNTPVWGETYSIPFQEMSELQAPVLNVGPFGKDAHQRTERLHVDSAFIEMPIILEKLVKTFITN